MPKGPKANRCFRRRPATMPVLFHAPHRVMFLAGRLHLPPAIPWWCTELALLFGTGDGTIWPRFEVYRPRWPLGLWSGASLAHGMPTLPGAGQWVRLVDGTGDAASWRLTLRRWLRASLTVPLLGVLQVAFLSLGIGFAMSTDLAPGARRWRPRADGRPG